MSRRRVIVVGPGRDLTGGIAAAMTGYLEALDRAGLLHSYIESRHHRGPTGRFLPWMMAFPRLVRRIRAVRRDGDVPVVWAHAGESRSVARKAPLLRASRAAGARTMLHLHAPNVDWWLEGRASRWALEQALSGLDRVGVLLPWWERRLREAGIDAKLAIVPNPLPPRAEEQAHRPRSQRAPGPVRILTMARLAPGKGVDVAVEAMAHLPEGYELLVAGEGPERAALEARVRALGQAHRVGFLGWIAAEAKAAALERADVFCLPSTFDSFGMGYLEAMAWGLPVVACAYNAIVDVVPDGVAGRLVDTPDPVAVAAALEEVAGPEARARLGEAGKAWVLDRFAVDAVAERLPAALPG